MLECRSASRAYEQAIDFHYSLGFRIVKECPQSVRRGVPIARGAVNSVAVTTTGRS
jgi:hypothetical protein